MALVRATLPTALPTVRQFVADFKKLAREAGSSPALDNLALSLDGLEASANRKSVDVELILLAPLDAEEANRVSAWLGPGFPPAPLLAPPADPVEVGVPGPPLELRVQLRAARGRAPRKAGAARPGVLVLIANRPVDLDEDALSALDRAFEDRPHVVLLASAKPSAPASAPPALEGPGAEEGGPAGEPPAPALSPADDPFFKNLEARAKAGAWTSLTHRILPELSLQARLAATPWDSLQDLFRAHSVAGALDSLMGVFEMAVEQQEKDIRVNKAVTQQKLAKFGPQKGPGAAASPIADLLADLKTRTQRLSQEFERGAAERLQDLLGLPAGALVRETEALLAGLNDLETEPKAKTLGVKVPAEFEEKANRLIRERVAKHCGADLVALNDLFRLIGQEIEKTLAQAQNPPIVVQFRYLTDERVRRMLDMYGIFQAVFKGDIPSPGFSEYFASVRKYSMLLVMGASMFGAAAILRQYKEYTIPITVLLVGFGIYQVAISTRQQRIETMENQLDAARTQMRQEFRRIIGELQKQWSATLNQYLSEQIAGALAEIDAGIKESQGKKGGGDANPERDRLLRQAQTLEASEKRLAASGKTRDALAGSISQIRGDLKGLMPGPGGAAGARPGMPMPGGLAGARPGMPAMPARPGMPAMPGAGGAAKPSSLADAKASAMADAKAKIEAMKAAKAAPPAGATSAAGAVPGEAKPSAMAAFQAKMAASKAAKAAPPAAEPTPAASAEPPAPAAPPPAPPSPAAAPAETKPNAAAAFQAKMAAMKAAREAGKAAPAGAETPAVAAPASSPASPVAAPSPAPPAPPAPADQAPPPAEPKPNAAAAFQAKMAAMKAAREAGKAAAPVAKPAATPAAGAAEGPAVPAVPAETPADAQPAAAADESRPAVAAAGAPAPAAAAPAVAPAPAPPAPVAPAPEPPATLEMQAEPPTGFEETIAFETPIVPLPKPE